jgi:hypothetical protein
MTIYRVKLHDKASGESRHASVAADSKDEAIYICEQQELGHVGFWLPDSEVSELEAKEAAGTLSGRDKARLYSHRQAKTYDIVSAKGDED